jgi:sulfonate transport system substrate-binding protein
MNIKGPAPMVAPWRRSRAHAARGAQAAPAARRPGALPLAASLLAAGALAAACSSGGSSAASSPSASASGTSSASTTSLSQVTLHVGDQAGSGSEALLTAAGLISKLPFKVSWSDFTSGPPMLQAMGAGAIDIGGVGDAPPVFAAAGGEKVAIVGALQANPLGSALLVPKGSAIHSVAELRGKKIAVAEGSSADYHLLAVLKKAGLTVKDVTVVNLQPAQAEAAFASGAVDAWDVWSPYIEQAEAQHGARVLVNGTSIGTTYSFEVASRDALADPAKAAAIRAYLRLLDQAHAWAATHQSSWASVWAKATGLPDSVMTDAAKDSVATAVPITPAVVSSEQQIANAFSSAGLIPAHVDFAKFSDTSFNNAVGGSS